MDPAPTRYVECEGAALAYQVIGTGAGDAFVALELTGHLDLLWTDPYFHALFERAAPHARLVMAQRRGLGLSEPINYVPTIEQQADDIIAVMDAAGLRHTTLVGSLTTCAAVALVAARDPDRVSNLILVQPYAAGGLSDMAIEAGWPPDDIGRLIDRVDAVSADWGSGATIDIWDASLSSPYNRRLIAMMERCSAAPSTAQDHVEWMMQTSFAQVFKAVAVPTTIFCVPGSVVPEVVVQTVAGMIDDAQVVRLPVNPPGTSIGESWVPIFDCLIEKASGAAAPTDIGRFLGTVLFTDVVGSTELLNALGDGAYRELLDAHERRVRAIIDEHGGRLVNTSGDGTFSVFDGPSKAVRAAQAICADARDLGIEVRLGAHSGELEHTHSHDVTGMTVHIGARVAAAAGAGEVLVSRAVHDLAIGSGLTFHSKGEHELRGVPGQWELYALADSETAASAPPADPIEPRAMDRAALRFAQRAPRFTRGAVAAGNAWQRRRAKPD